MDYTLFILLGLGSIFMIFMGIWIILFQWQINQLNRKVRLMATQEEVDTLNTTLQAIGTEVDAIGTDVEALHAQLEELQNNTPPEVDLSGAIASAQAILNRVQNINAATPEPTDGDSEG